MEESKQPFESVANMEPQTVESLLVALLEQMNRLTLHMDKHALLRKQPQAQPPLNAQQRAANDWLLKYQIYYLPPVTFQEALNVMENIVHAALNLGHLESESEFELLEVSDHRTKWCALRLLTKQGNLLGVRQLGKAIVDTNGDLRVRTQHPAGQKANLFKVEDGRLHMQGSLCRWENLAGGEEPQNQVE